MGRPVLVGVLLALSACVVPLSTAGRQIRVVDDQKKSTCSFLGIVTGSNSTGLTGSDDMDGALNEVRNKASALGANSIRLIQVQTQGNVWQGGAAYATAEAYMCP